MSRSILQLLVLGLLMALACGEGEPTATPYYGQWETHDYRDPITDEGEFRLRLNSSESYVRNPSQLSGLGSDAVLHLSCDTERVEGRAAMWVVWPAYITANKENTIYSKDFKEVTVDWRADSDAPITAVWLLDYTMGTDQSHFTVSSRGLPIVEDLGRSEKVAVRAYTDGKEQATAIFRPVGFSDAYEPIRDICPKEEW